MGFTKLEASVILDGVEISPYIISLKRNHSLCGIVQTFTIDCDRTLLDYLQTNNVELKTSNPVTIYEMGVKKLTGNVRSIKYGRTPDYILRIEGTDYYKYAKDYFIDSDLGTSNGEPVTYWIGRLFELVNLSYVIDSSEISSRNVGPGVSFNLRSVDEALTEVLSYASAYVYVDAEGVAHIQKGALPSNQSLTGGPQGNVKQGSHELSDINTRDVAKVWGFKGAIPLLPTESPFIFAEETVNLNLPVAKTVVYASNYVQTNVEAQRLASTMIASLGKFDSVKKLQIVGNPNLFIGRRVSLDVDLETSLLQGQATVTSIDSSMDKEGYQMGVGLDEFCPKFAGWELASPTINIYAGTTASGVYKSMDRGLTWAEYNLGLPTTKKYVSRLGFNIYDEGMGIVNQKLYHVMPDSQTWQLINLPAPIIDENYEYGTYGRLISVDSVSSTPGAFNVLTSIGTTRTLVSGEIIMERPEARSIVYSTQDAGLNWTQAKIHDEENYNLYGTDLSSRFGIPYVVTTNNVEEPINAGVYTKIIHSPKRYAYRSTWNPEISTGIASDKYQSTRVDPEDYGVIDFVIFTNNYGPLPRPSQHFGPLLTGSWTGFRNISFPIYCIIAKPHPDKNATLRGVNCYWQYSNFESPTFEEMSPQNISSVNAASSQYRNIIGLMGRGLPYLGNEGVLSYDTSYGNIALTDVTGKIPFANEYDYNPNFIYGDGYRGSMGLSFDTQYYIDNPNYPTHPDILYVTTGFRSLTDFEVYNTYMLGDTLITNNVSHYIYNRKTADFSAGTLFWEFQ